LWIYLKMVISIAYSPLQIALYALPGNDDKLEMWLKQMIAWGASIFGMRVVMDLCNIFAFSLILQAFATAGSGGGLTGGAIKIVSGSLFNILLVPTMIVFGYATAIKVPDVLQEMIVGKPKR